MKFIALACLFVTLLFSTSLVECQSTDATISGVVFDTAGKVIPNAVITILNEATEVHYGSETNDVGIYTISTLPPGQYRVQVSKNGFKTIIKPGIILNVQSALALNFTLPIGATSESITVDAGSSLVNSTDASVSTVIDQKFVANMPLNGRSFQDLISMTPGVVTQSPQAGSSLGYSGDFSVNGQRTESNYYMVDGVSANIGAGNGYGASQPANSGSVSAATALGTTQSLISVDALQEFRVQSSTYSAEYGRTPGGQFSLLTRSGGNQFHGSLYDYLRNDVFDANDWFNDRYDEAKPALRLNDFGGTLGGPIILPGLYREQDKTFFFGSYEGLRLTQPQAATIEYVPDVALRNNAPAALQPILNAFPEPTAGGIDYGSVAQFIEPYSLPSQIDSTSVRVDEALSRKLSVFFRFGDTPSVTSMRNLSSLTKQQLNTQTYTLGATSQFSTTLANELRLGYARSNSVARESLDAFGGAQPIDLASTMGLGAYATPLSEVNLYFPGIGQALLSSETGSNKGRQWNLLDTIAVSQGRHQFKLGIDYRHIKSPLQPPDASVAAIFESASSILNNSANVLSLYKYEASTPVFDEVAAFVQDEWHLASRINLSLGLRWEVNPPPTGEHGNDAYTLVGNVDEPNSLSLAPRDTPLWKTTYFNFAPRLGVVWQVHSHPGRETVLRSGGGVFFDTDNEFATLGFTALGFSANSTLFGEPLPVSPTQLNFSPSVSAPYTGSTVYAFPAHLQLPYTLQWNVALQQALGKQQAATLTYIGANGRRLLQEQTQSVSSLNPDFSSIAYLAAGITSNYQALQVQLQRTVSHGIQALAAYTWSHSLDYGSTASELTLTRGNSDYDVRNNFQAGISWDVPKANSKGIWSSLMTAWGLDGRVMARTGFPITLEGNYLTDPSTGREYYSNVDLVSGQPVYLYGSQYPGGRALNPQAFDFPTGDNPGRAPRNFIRGFGATQVNLAARREFHLHENLHLQFRAESFNLPNHPNFGYVDPYLGDATFGQATEMLNHSLGTVASQFQQGGPRSLQFALKLAF